VTRRGKQFNSIVHDDREHATGYGRDAVLVSAGDARRLGLADGDRVRLSNALGSYEGILCVAEIAEGSVQVYWPEANVLLDSSARSPLAHVPAYKGGSARLEWANGGGAQLPAIKV
jgi:anaerobic selenocysteine-containing dehydrogenase